MRRAVAILADEADRQIHDKLWELTPGDRALAVEAMNGLRKAVGPPEAQESLAQIDRLERLRETLAVLAICLARTHGRLAWFLSGGIEAIEPVLRWRALPAQSGRTFGTVQAGAEEYTEAEEAVRRLQDALARIIAESGTAEG